jgi:hypothetical protein
MNVTATPAPKSSVLLEIEVPAEQLDRAVREAGKPPWAGGWRRVGERHPGWSQEKADRMKAKFGDCFPPGQCKDKGAKPGGGASDDEESKD